MYRVSMYSYDEYVHEFLEDKTEHELYEEDLRTEVDADVLEVRVL